VTATRILRLFIYVVNGCIVASIHLTIFERWWLHDVRNDDSHSNTFRRRHRNEHVPVYGLQLEGPGIRRKINGDDRESYSLRIRFGRVSTCVNIQRDAVLALISRQWMGCFIAHIVAPACSKGASQWENVLHSAALTIFSQWIVYAAAWSALIFAYGERWMECRGYNCPCYWNQ